MRVVGHSAARSGGGDRRADRGRRHSRTRWFAFNDSRDVIPPRRGRGGASLADGRRVHDGVEPPAAATPAAPSFFKDFQTFPRKFQGNSKPFANFSKDFQTFSLAVSREIKGLWASRPGIAFSPILRRLDRYGRPGDTRPNALAIQSSANSDYRKEIVDGGFPGGASGQARRRTRHRERRPPPRRRSAASAVDPRIKVLEALDPWGDWPTWLATSPFVPADERAEYVKPEFLKKVSTLEPVDWLPRRCRAR